MNFGPGDPHLAQGNIDGSASCTGMEFYLNFNGNGDTGDFVGDYEVFARTSRYSPYYDLDSPLHSLDWGTQFDGTSRNPEGA